MATNPAIISLAAISGANGFRLNGISAYDYSGGAVSAAGDINGDGFDDIIVGSKSSSPNGEQNAGQGYVIFGRDTAFPAAIELSTLNGSNGFRIDGSDPLDLFSSAVSNAGDVNGDGFDDIIIGAWRASTGTRYATGESYVIFGKSGGFKAAFDLTSLDGSNGFRIDGSVDNDRSGSSVSDAGDINGDGFDDIIIGAPGSGAGECLVVFGRATGFSATLAPSSLTGSNGFKILGSNNNDGTGYSVAAAGDINGDGFDDILVGAPKADPGGDTYGGAAYVIFGKASGFSATLAVADLNGTTGFRLSGIDAYDATGRTVASAGDINNDGFDDILIAAYHANAGAGPAQGESYVIFGKSSGFDADLDLSTLNGQNGFRLTGVAPGDLNGVSASTAGDLNGDGFDDIIIGANQAGPGGKIYAGESYVVFGKATGFDASMDLASLNGSNGFRIAGAAAGDASGSSVSATGDVNNDGFADLLVSSPGADSATTGSGATYVLFGRATAAVTRMGTTVADRLFGGDYNDSLNGAGGNDTLNGRTANDRLIGSIGFDSLIGGKGRDTLTGGTNSDRFKFTAGDSGRTGATMDYITDFTKGALNVGDKFDFSSALTRGGAGAGAGATADRASISQTTGIASFAAGSGTTLADAIHDIATRWTLSTDSLGEYALFRVNNTGAFHIFVSDGVAGVTANDVLVQLTNVTSISTVSLNGGDLTILT